MITVSVWWRTCSHQCLHYNYSDWNLSQKMFCAFITLSFSLRNDGPSWQVPFQDRQIGLLYSRVITNHKCWKKK